MAQPLHQLGRVLSQAVRSALQAASALGAQLRSRRG
jgi:hypothetical protein